MPHIGIGSQAGKIPGAPTVTGVSQVASAVHVAFTEPDYKEIWINYQLYRHSISGR